MVDFAADENFVDEEDVALETDDAGDEDVFDDVVVVYVVDDDVLLMKVDVVFVVEDVGVVLVIDLDVVVALVLAPATQMG